jgi:hypothetical protein
MQKSKMQLVVAGNYQQFLYQYPDADPKTMRYISCPQDLMGWHPDQAEIVKIGTWYAARPDILEEMWRFLSEHEED